MNYINNKIFEVSVITYEEACNNFSENENILYTIDKAHKNKFCKAEVHRGFLCLKFYIPDKNNYIEKSDFLCLITKNKVLFIDDSGKVGYCIKKMQKNKVLNVDSMGRFLYDFLETLVEPELRYLEGFSDRITKMENSVVSGNFNKFDHKMFSIRKEILAFYRYYSQLIDIGQELQENENGFFDDEEVSYFKLFTDRVDHFHEESKMLQEYTLQLREIYQTQFDIVQNKIMKMLTIVTTIFSPLTIIVGWYGMNFVHMPELSWQYGYSYVILLSIIVTAVSVWVLRRSKFL